MNINLLIEFIYFWSNRFLNDCSWAWVICLIPYKYRDFGRCIYAIYIQLLNYISPSFITLTLLWEAARREFREKREPGELR